MTTPLVGNFTGIQMLFALFVSSIMPLVVAWFKRSSWPRGVKILCMFVLAVLFGLVDSAIIGRFDLNNVAETASIAATLAAGYYRLWFKQDNSNDQAEKAILNDMHTSLQGRSIQA